MFEDYVLERIGFRLAGFLGNEGRKLLERLVREELGTESTAREEAERVRIALAEVKAKIDSLLESLTPLNKEFVDEKLRALKAYKDRLEARLAALGGPRPRVDVRAIVDAGIARLCRLGELLRHGSLDEQKMLVQSFLARMEISPTRNEGAAYFATLPADVGSLSFQMVAGARHEPLQTKSGIGAPRFEPVLMRLGPPDRFVVNGRGLRKCA